MSELKPCPFCGSTEVDLACGDDVGLTLKITCGHCMGSGPRDFKTQGANANWNRRPIEDHLRARVRELEGVMNKIKSTVTAWEEIAHTMQIDERYAASKIGVFSRELLDVISQGGQR